MSRVGRKIGKFIRRKVLPGLMKASSITSKVARFVPIPGVGAIAGLASAGFNKLAERAIKKGDQREAERVAKEKQ